MRGLLERGAGVNTREHERSERSLTKNTCKEMLEVEPAMWLFIQKPEVGLTNNEAERALRHAVMWRRVSFGSQSQGGAEMVGRLLTVGMTLKRRGESIHKYMVEACRARNEGRAAPSLLPATERPFREVRS
jgi:transposase